MYYKIGCAHATLFLREWKFYAAIWDVCFGPEQQTSLRVRVDVGYRLNSCIF